MRASLGCVGIPVLAAASLIGLMKVFSSAMECEVEVCTNLFGGRFGCRNFFSRHLGVGMSEGFFVPIEELSYLLDHIVMFNVVLG